MLNKTLIEYRIEKSKETQKPLYMIFTNETLNELVKQKPINVSDFLKIKGIGPKKLEEFGEEIISIIKLNIENQKCIKCNLNIEKNPLKPLCYKCWKK